MNKGIGIITFCRNCEYVRVTQDRGKKYYCEREMPRRLVEYNGYCKWGKSGVDEHSGCAVGEDAHQEG